MSINYNKTGDIIEIIVRDGTLRKVGSWKFNTSDTELASGILKHIQRKYGFTPEIKPSENVPTQKEQMKKEFKEPNFWDMSCDWQKGIYTKVISLYR